MAWPILGVDQGLRPEEGTFRPSAGAVERASVNSEHANADR